VYRAWDAHLEREVALKVPQAAVLASPKRIERFLREAKAAAGLRHPSIVPVYDAGEDGEVRYIASAFIEGKPLSSAVQEGGVDCQRAARIVAQLADALGYAHGLGVVHRDVKPANVMLDANDRPHLMDFGLAARLESTEKLTHEGAVLGTPSYMAPEQAAGQQGEARTESDQYALGVVLYELLTGRTPFEGPPQIVLFNVLKTEPPAPRKLRKDIPRDLETICLKAMAKSPDDRYSDCQALCTDLERWLEGEPIRARRLGLGERFVRWCRREPKLAAASGLMALSLVLLAIAAGLVGIRHYQNLWNEETEKRGVAEAARDKAIEDLETEQDGHGRTRRDLNLGYLNQARARLDAEDRTGAYRILASCPAEYRGWAWQHLRLLAEGSGQAVRIFRLPVAEGRFTASGLAGIAFTLDSQFLAGLDRDNSIYFWHVGIGKRMRTLRLARHDGSVRMTAFSANGRIAVSVFQPPEKIPLPEGVRADAEFHVAAQKGPRPKEPAPRPHVVVIWDTVTGQKLHAVEGPAGDRILLHLAGDGSRVAVAAGQWNQPAEVRVYDVKSGKEVLAKRERLEHLRHLALSLDGKTLVTISGDWSKPAVLSFQDSATGEETLKLEGNIGGIEQVVYSADGKLVLTGGGGERIVTKQVAVPEMQTYEVEVEVIEEVTKEVDGKKVTEKVKVRKKEPRTRTVYKTMSVTEKHGGGEGAELRVWSASSGKLLHTLPGCGGGGPLAAAVSPDGALLARVCHGPCSPTPHLSLYDLRHGGLLLLKVPVPEGINIAQLAFSPNGLHLAGAEQFGQRVVLWSATGNRLLYQYDAHNGPVTHLAFSRRGRLLSSYSACNGSARVWAVRTGKDLIVTKQGGGHGDGYGAYGGMSASGALTFSPDGKRLTNQPNPAAGCYGFSPGGAEVSAWDRQTGKPIEFPKGVGRVLAMSPDGTLLVTAPQMPTAKPGAPGPARLPAEVSRLDRPALDDHSLLAAVLLLQPPPGDEPPAEVKVRDASTGKEVCTLKGLPAFGVGIGFSPDSKRVLSTTSMGWDERGPRTEVKVWNARTGAVLLTHSQASGLAAFSPDSTRLASVHVPPLPPRPPEKLPPPGGPPLIKPAALRAAAPPPKGEGPKRKELPPPARPITEIKVFDLSDGKESLALKSSEALENVQRLHFSPDGKTLVAVWGRWGEQPRVAGWDAKGGTQTFLRTDFAGVLAFSPSGKLLAVSVESSAASGASSGTRRVATTARMGKASDQGFGPPRAITSDEPAQAIRPTLPEVKVLDLATGKVRLSLGDHKERITAIAFSPDERRIATTGGLHPGVLPRGEWSSSVSEPGTRRVAPRSTTGEVYVRDIFTGTILATFLGHTGPVTAVAFSPDGIHLATGGLDGSVKVLVVTTITSLEGFTWFVGQPTVISTLGSRGLRHWETVENVAFSPDGKIVASSGNDEVIRLHDAATGDELRVLSGHQSSSTHRGVRALAFHPEGKLLASGTWDGIKLWDPATGQLVRTLVAPRGEWSSSVSSLHSPRSTSAPGAWPGRILCLAFSPDGRTLAAGTETSRSVQLWDPETGVLRRTIPVHKEAVAAVCFHPNGKEFATASFDGTAKRWNLADGKEVRTFTGHKGRVWSVQFAARGKVLVTGGSDGAVKLWDADSGKETKSLDGKDGEVLSVAVHPEGTVIASGHGNRSVKLWNLDDDKPIRTYSVHLAEVRAVAFDRAGKRLVSGSTDRSVRILDVTTDKVLLEPSGHIGQVFAVAWGSRKPILASAGWDHTIRLWSRTPTSDRFSRWSGISDTWRERVIRDAHAGPVYGLTFLDNDKELASIGEDGVIRFWDVASGKPTRQFRQDGTGAGRTLTVSPDGTMLAAGYSNPVVYIWDREGGSVKWKLVGHKGEVVALAFSSDSGALTTGSHDGTVKAWNLSTGRVVHTIPSGEGGRVSSVALARTRAILVVAHERDQVRVWDIVSAKLIRVLTQDSNVSGLSLAPDDRIVASSDNRSRIKITDPMSGIEWETVVLGPWYGRIAGIAFAPRFGALATANGDGTVSILRFPR
jgi:WD40 repeat protein